MDAQGIVVAVRVLFVMRLAMLAAGVVLVVGLVLGVWR